MRGTCRERSPAAAGAPQARHAPPKVLHRVERVHGPQPLPELVHALLLGRVVEPQRPAVLQRVRGRLALRRGRRGRRLWVARHGCCGRADLGCWGGQRQLGNGRGFAGARPARAGFRRARGRARGRRASGRRAAALRRGAGGAGKPPPSLLPRQQRGAAGRQGRACRDASALRVGRGAAARPRTLELCSGASPPARPRPPSHFHPSLANPPPPPPSPPRRHQQRVRVTNQGKGGHAGLILTPGRGRGTPRQGKCGETRRNGGAHRRRGIVLLSIRGQSFPIEGIAGVGSCQARRTRGGARHSSMRALVGAQGDATAAMAGVLGLKATSDACHPARYS